MRNFTGYQKFFDVKGVTSTSANYLSNMAKEIINTYDVLKNISFKNLGVKAMGDSAYQQVEFGISQKDFDNLENTLMVKAKLSALISWFREAIKAREEQLEKIDDMTFSEWMQDVKGITDLNLGIVIPTYERKRGLTKEEYIEQNFSVKELNEYFFLQSVCATMGKFVHPQGNYAVAKDYITKYNDTTNIKETNSANLLYNIQSSIELNEIEKKFFVLQDIHRSYQKRLNEIQFKVETATRQYNDAIVAEEKKHKAEEAKLLAKIEEGLAEYRKEFHDWKVEELNRLRSLKIVIPNELQDAYEIVSNYGK